MLGVLSEIAFVVCSTYHSILQENPRKSILDMDIMLNIRHITYRRVMIEHKQQWIDVKIKFTYLKGKIKNIIENFVQVWPRLSVPHNGPYEIILVKENNTVVIQLVKNRKILNIRPMVKPTDNAMIPDDFWVDVQTSSGLDTIIVSTVSFGIPFFSYFMSNVAWNYLKGTHIFGLY